MQIIPIWVIYQTGHGFLGGTGEKNEWIWMLEVEKASKVV